GVTGSVRPLHHRHDHYRFSSLRLFISCIEQPVTHCRPTYCQARRPFQTFRNQHHAAQEGKVRRVNK
ncbi:hypothetical protein M405DRAFT_812497, partial [Rhizopogon salebrosus TDB-379]